MTLRAVVDRYAKDAVAGQKQIKRRFSRYKRFPLFIIISRSPQVWVAGILVIFWEAGSAFGPMPNLRIHLLDFIHHRNDAGFHRRSTS